MSIVPSQPRQHTGSEVAPKPHHKGFIPSRGQDPQSGTYSAYHLSANGRIQLKRRRVGFRSESTRCVKPNVQHYGAAWSPHGWLTVNYVLGLICSRPENPFPFPESNCEHTRTPSPSPLSAKQNKNNNQHPKTT